MPYIYPICKKCNKEKEIKTNSYCKKCSKQYYLDRNKKDNIDKNKIKEFLQEIDNRKGQISLYELFVDLITYYNSISDNLHKIDHLQPKDQLSIMWFELRKYCGIE